MSEIIRPERVLCFLDTGRLVKIREGGTDWGWGVVVNVREWCKAKAVSSPSWGKGPLIKVALINDTRYPFNALKERASRWKLCYKKAGRSSSSVQVRLLRFWEARNVRRGGELMGVDMLLLDSQATMVPATISVHRLETHRSNLKAGSVYTLKGFDVAQCNPNYRLSDSSLLIRFKDVTDPAIPIPPESFHFRNHSEMLGLANTNHQLQGMSLLTASLYKEIFEGLQGSKGKKPMWS
ncbi:hypothetical protein Bca4012_027380 [Brassica carinata]